MKKLLFFGLVLLLLVSTVSAYTLKENYMVNDDTQMYIHSTQWAAQTFNTSTGYDLKIVGVKLYQATDYMINVSLYPTNASGHPDCSGTPLVSAEVNGSTLGGTPGAFVNFTFGSAYTLVADTNYAIVVYVECVGMTGTDWRLDGSSAAYANGIRYVSIDTGASWSGDVDDDMMFSTYSDTASSSCTYSSGNWTINAGDSCAISTTTDLLGNNLLINGTGTVNLTGTIHNATTITIQGVTLNIAGGTLRTG